jgi:membrane-bound lytic murein transglycosylase D
VQNELVFMRKNYSWLLVVLLAGCQINQPTNQKTASTNVDSPTVVKSTRHLTADNFELSRYFESSQSGDEPDLASNDESTDDLWQRITAQFELTVPDQEEVDYYRNWYIKHPKHLETVARRAKPFLHLIVEKIEERGLPLELALLPVVESSFDTHANSYGGAAGLWQFVPSTGKRYGLTQNSWYDGRRDVAASTDAALDYLSNLNKTFKGNWNQTIAAYNSGSGRVANAIKQNKRQGKPTNIFSLDLPDETSSYVPKLLALADVIKNHKEYGLYIPSIPNEPTLALVDPNEQLDLSIAAQYAGITLKQLQRYNPGFSKSATTPNGPQALLIPVENLQIFQQNLAENQGQGLRYSSYTIKKGDSLGLIAQRQNSTVDEIKRANGLKNSAIRIGQSLLIPNANGKPIALARNTQHSTKSKSLSSKGMVHTVSSGDTVSALARKYGVSSVDIAKWNGLNSKSHLKIGQTLIVSLSPENTLKAIIYKIRYGDSLSKIASQFNVSIDDIIKWNDLEGFNYLEQGREIKLYIGPKDDNNDGNTA